ncbi:MAG: RICIN domain-containing protein, partial [Oscillospiraceae bacterium]|nr:RICIN domain-containing protein [Oscillospiraceae bacterium]
MATRKHKWLAVLLSLFLAITWLLPLLISQGSVPAQAASVDYPAQLMNIATKDGTKVLTENGTADGSTLSVKALGNDLSPSWRFDRVGKDSNGTFFKLTNVQSGRLLTPQNYKVSAGTSVIMYGSESAKSQHWFVIPVSKDHLGNDLYYKIVNYENTSLALTQTASGMTLDSYTGADTQLWLLNADGLQGFAGYCKNDGTGVKAADIGGLFGEVVEVSTFADLKKYAEASDPYTIIVKGRIDGGSNYKVDSQSHYYNPDGRIYVTDNKTIVGSYGSHVTYNVALCTKQGGTTGNNVIIRNLEMQHDANSNGNDNIIVYFSAGQNLWVDHVTFVGHSDYNKAASGQPDYDKFLACCYGADYLTVSDCSFGLHEYGLILGYPDDTADVKSKYDGFPRITLASNKFYKTLTRGPGLMRWGYFHSFNNYVDTFSMAYTVHSGCDIYAENCYYANGGNV